MLVREMVNDEPFGGSSSKHICLLLSAGFKDAFHQKLKHFQSVLYSEHKSATDQRFVLVCVCPYVCVCVCESMSVCECVCVCVCISVCDSFVVLDNFDFFVFGSCWRLFFVVCVCVCCTKNLEMY